MRPVDRLTRTCRRQLGLFHLRQSRRLGISDDRVRRLVESGWLERLQRCVYGVAGVPDSWERRALAAQLAGGPEAVLSHTTAARLHGLEAPGSSNAIHLTFPRERPRSVPGARTHTTLTLPRRDRRRSSPFVLTSVERTICGLAELLTEDELEAVLLEAWRLGLTSPRRILVCLRRLGRVRGAAVLRRVLERCEPGVLRCRSPYETLAFVVLRDGGLPAPKVNYEIRDADGRLRFVIDLAYPDVKLAIEVDSARYHTIGPDRRADDRRQRKLEAEGWRFIRVTTGELRRDPHGFANRVRAALA